MGLSGDEYLFIRRIVPILIASLIMVSFGMMLGWPSLAYPHLMNMEVSPIPISFDESSLIAGFLMEGNTLGVLFATSKVLPSKLAICLCFGLQATGWVVMYYSVNIFWFLASRASVGFANGYAWGQIRRYVHETCDENLERTVNRYMPLGLSVGVLVISVMGLFLNFRCIALLSLSVPVFGFVAFALFPKMKKEVPENRLNNVICAQDKNDLAKDMALVGCTTVKPWNAIKVVQDRESFKYMLITFLLVFVQQYSGGPANIVYSQLIFVDTKNPYPHVCSVIYASGFVLSMGIALKYAPSFSRKFNLLTSTAVCIVCISSVSLYSFLRQQLLEINELFVWAPLFLLVMYNFFHTFSYGVLPTFIMSENMPEQSTNTGNKFLIIHFSMSAVISTKIFQVLFAAYGMAVAYAFFACVLVAAFLIIICIDDYGMRKKLDIPVLRVEEGHVNSAYMNTEGRKKF